MFNGYEGWDAENPWHEPDFILSYLVSSLVNLAETPLGITLLVKGVLITGTLMSEREYLATLSRTLQTQVRRFTADMNPEERKAAEAAFDLTDLTEDHYPEDDDEQDDVEMSAITHIHLREPVLVTGQGAVGMMQGALPVMRIRIANIDGWMLGASLPGFPDLPDDGGIRH